MFDSNYDGVKSDFTMTLRIIYWEELSDVFVHSMRSNDVNESTFMPRKTVE